MDKANLLTSPMVVCSLDVTKDLFCHCEKSGELLGSEVPYLRVIGALIYLANYAHPDIAFSINFLAMYSCTPTQRHLNGINHILPYLQGTTYMSLFYAKKSKW